MRIIAGSARGRKLIPPRDRSIRPALDRIRESVFAVIGDEVVGGQVLDLFAGVGAFGLEALSRGARRVRFVDRSRPALEILSKNLGNLGFEPLAVVSCADALVSPPFDGDDERYDLIFMDPPFEMFRSDEGARRVYRRAEELLASSCAAEEAMLVFRQPSSYRGERLLEARQVKVYGESTVLFLWR